MSFEVIDGAGHSFARKAEKIDRRALRFAKIRPRFIKAFFHASGTILAERAFDHVFSAVKTGFSVFKSRSLDFAANTADLGEKQLPEKANYIHISSAAVRQRENSQKDLPSSVYAQKSRSVPIRRASFFEI